MRQEQELRRRLSWRDPCEGVVCEDDGNARTDAECVDKWRVRNLEQHQRVAQRAAEANWPSTAVSKTGDLRRSDALL